MSNKQGRNEQCACGSGKKYKKCCWGIKISELPFEKGSYDEVVSSATLYAATLGWTASVGEINTKEGFEDEEGFTEWHSLEIEFLCPHGNGTDSLLYCRFGVAGQPMPQIAEDSPWELEETGTEAWFDNCRCPGVT